MNAGQLEQASKRYAGTLEIACTENGQCQYAACTADRPRDQDCRACNQCPVLRSVARLWRVTVNILLFLFHTAVCLFVVAIWGNDTNKALLIVLVAIHSVTVQATYFLWNTVKASQRELQDQLRRMEARQVEWTASHQPHELPPQQLTLSPNQTPRAILAQ